MLSATGHVIYGIDGRASYALAPLDEYALFTGGADIGRLLVTALRSSDGGIQPQELGALPIVDFELIMAHFCIANFGDRVGQNLNCAACGKKYSVEFSLGAYVSLLTQEIERNSPLEFRGQPVALPSCDIIANAGPEGLIPALWGQTDTLTQADIAALEQLLEKACPVLQEEIGGPCPDCNTEHHFMFVLRDWVIEKLKIRLRNLVVQVHLLASHYHWCVGDIFALSRSSRLALVDTIQGHVSRLAPVASS